MNTNNISPEVKNKSINQYPENCSKAGPSTSVNSWQDKGRDRKNGKKRDRSPEKEWNKDKAPHLRNRENLRENESKDRLKEEQQLHSSQQCLQQPMQIQSSANSTSFPSNGYPTSDYLINVDPSQNYMMPSYNMYNTINQWGAAVNPSMPGMEMASTSSGINHPYPYVDPTMYGMMTPMQGYIPMPVINSAPPPPQKLMKTFASCTLYPPPPTAPTPSRRDRPLGCKTVFVGGLPEKITEEIIKEAFSDCGEIATVRMSKKNFCHIRFTNEKFVDEALCFSGYRIKIENKDEAPYSGRLHVDYAIARDDQYEYECFIRTMNRENRHANENDTLRVPSPPPIVNYSECEAATVGENLRNEETFKKALQVLITWLDRGECNKRNAGTFYSMIQSTNSHIRRLKNEKDKIEEEVRQAKCKLTQKSTTNGLQYNDIKKVFDCALMQKVWDHFTKAQRKNIVMWKDHCIETIETNLNDLLGERIEDEMEMSDGEERDESEGSGNPAEMKEELNRLREEHASMLEENELLRSQLRAASNETALVKEEGEKKICALGETYQLMQQNYLETKKKLEEVLKAESLRNMENVPMDTNRVTSACNGSCRSAPGTINITESETCLVALIATFLNVHPFGASIEYICSYLVKMDPTVNTRDVESLMKKFPTVFKEECSGIGASLEKKWTFLGFKF